MHAARCTAYESVAKLSEKIFTEFEFSSGATTNTPLSEVLKLRKGVCQDFTHLMIASLRSIGFAARYVRVSGNAP
jgi:transglutaminase-like putative cysteine protease